MSQYNAETILALSNLQEEFRRLTNTAADCIGRRMRVKLLGCRLLHWNPELEKVRAEPSGSIVYQPLDIRIGSRPHAFFARVYKTKYSQPGQKRSDPCLPERQYGITYTDLRPKGEVTPILDAFKDCATKAGGLVGSLAERLASTLPAQTLATRNDLHRWIFTVYDVAWMAPPDSPQSATRYIPLTGFDAAMQTDESVLYDLTSIRKTRWKKIEKRLDPNRWGSYSHFKEFYAAWGKELPEYYASRIDDILQASDWAIDWLLKEVQGAS